MHAQRDKSLPGAVIRGRRVHARLYGLTATNSETRLLCPALNQLRLSKLNICSLRLGIFIFYQQMVTRQWSSWGSS